MLRVKAPGEIDLWPGLQAWAEELPDMTVTHSAMIGKCISRGKDADGYFYAWYEVTSYHYAADTGKAAAGAAEQNAANIDYLAMMTGVEFPEEADNDAQ